MATRTKTPGAPAKRSRSTSVESVPAAAKTTGRRTREAAEQPALQNLPEQDAPDGLATPPNAELHLEAPAAEPQLASAASGGNEDRAMRALDALKTLSEFVSEGIDTLRELRGAMRAMSDRLDQLAASIPSTGLAGSGQVGSDGPESASADDYQFGRDRDPGDAVPPGVAVMSPTPLSETDEAALHSLEELPKRGGRGQRGSRAKAKE